MKGISRYRRVVFVLQSPDVAPIAFDTAMRMAAAMEADLESLLVQDLRLMEAVSEAPGRLVSSRSGEPAPAGVGAILRRMFKLQTAQVHEALKAAAERWGVSWSLDTPQGGLAEILAARGAEQELVVLAAPSRRAGSLRAFVAALAAIAPAFRGAILLLGSGMAPENVEALERQLAERLTPAPSEAGGATARAPAEEPAEEESAETVGLLVLGHAALTANPERLYRILSHDDRAVLLLPD